MPATEKKNTSKSTKSAKPRAAKGSGTGGRSARSSTRSYSRTNAPRRPARVKSDLDLLREREIVGFVIIVTAVLLLIGFAMAPARDAIDVSRVGVACGAVVRALRWLVGRTAFLLPLALLVLGCCICLDRSDRQLGRSIGVAMILLTVAGLAHISQPLQELPDYLSAAASGLHGGVLGGLLCFGLRKLLGTVGAVVILLALLVIGILLAFQTSFAEVGEYLRLLTVKLREKRQQRCELRVRRDAARVAATEAAAAAAKGTVGRRPLFHQHLDAPLITDDVMQEAPPPKKTVFVADFMPDISDSIGMPESSVTVSTATVPCSSFDLPSASSVVGSSVVGGRGGAMSEEERRSRIPVVDYSGVSILEELAAHDNPQAAAVLATPEEINNEAVGSSMRSLHSLRERSAAAPAVDWGDIAANMSEPESYFATHPQPDNASDEASEAVEGYDALSDEEQAVAAFSAFINDGIEQDAARTAAQHRAAPDDAGDSSNNDSDCLSASAPVSVPAPQPLPYKLPTPDLIEGGHNLRNPRMNKAITENIGVLERTLESFGVAATVTQVVAGPSVTRYELQPGPGVKVARITSLTDDIALALAAPGVRIEAPIPGRSVIGIEVSRTDRDTVYFRELIESDVFRSSRAALPFALGKNIGGDVIVGDLSKMPHLLIAGTTGSGKSVCMHSIICSLLFRFKPDELKLMLIDPKQVEMTQYARLPHLIAPVINNCKRAANSLKWVVNEMETRYSVFAGAGVKNFEEYNKANPEEKLTYIVVVIDELADLMMVARRDVEESLCRLAQLARAAGIHLVVATQRPSVDVVTGLIKANFPSRIALAVSGSADSRTMIGAGGAEKLLGDGDMLFQPIGMNKPVRVQGGFVDSKDVLRLVEYCAAQAAPHFSEEAVEASSTELNTDSGRGSRTEKNEAVGDGDELLYDAAMLIVSSGQASTSYLQRKLAIGNPRAARLMDMLEQRGIVGGPKGSKPRDILVKAEDVELLFAAGQM